MASGDRDDGQLETRLRLSKKDVRDAARLFELMASAIEDPASDQHSRPAAHRHQLVQRARAILNRRQLRQLHFNPAMFGEPSWEILLILYVAECEGDRQTPSKLATATGTPLSTTIRWIDYLDKKELVARQDHPTDKRVVFISLRERARSAMDAYLGSIEDVHARI